MPNVVKDPSPSGHSKLLSYKFNDYCSVFDRQYMFNRNDRMVASSGSNVRKVVLIIH